MVWYEYPKPNVLNNKKQSKYTTGQTFEIINYNFFVCVFEGSLHLFDSKTAILQNIIAM